MFLELLYMKGEEKKVDLILKMVYIFVQIDQMYLYKNKG